MTEPFGHLRRFISMRSFLLVLAAVIIAGTAPVRSASAQQPASRATELATFAGGCFWCMEPPFESLPGVISVTSGYTGGRTANPTYEQVSAGTTGHAEVVQIVFDPVKVSYAKLLEIFWRNIDPLTPNAQFCDEGSQYRSAIFAHGAAQLKAAEASRAELVRSRRFRSSIVTEILPAVKFYAAEEYHQDYYKKNPLRYKYYRSRCGRDQRLMQLWGGEVAAH